MTQPRIAAFDDALKAAGIPVDGVSGSGPECLIHFRPEATAQQITDGNAMRATFDWRPRKPKSLASVYQAIRGLTTGERDRLYSGVAAWAIIHDREFRELVQAQLGRTIEHDEVDA